MENNKFNTIITDKLRQKLNNSFNYFMSNFMKNLTNPIGLLVVICLILLLNSSCKDALGLDPNIKQTSLKDKANIVRDTIYLYPGSLDDSTYIVIIRYQNEKDSLQKIIDSLRSFYYPKLNPNVVNIDSNIFTETLFYKNLNGFEQKKQFKWNFNTKLLNIRLDTLENWPVATINYNLTENINQKIVFDNKEYFIKSFKVNTFRMGLLQVKDLYSNDVNNLNNYEMIVEDINGNIYKNPDFINKLRIWFSEMNINRLDQKIVKHSFVVNFEAIVAGTETKTVFRGATYVNYY
ncbi:MAG: hypothetical protein ACOVNU_03430 [Candidatus Kapaibacteriota bacterium]